MNIYTVAYALITIIVVYADRITKYLALTHLSKSSYYVNSWLSYELTINRGISWGMFHSPSSIVFSCVSLLIAVVTLVVCWHAADCIKKNVFAGGHILVIAGSFSNLVDRVWYGGVIDFIVVSYHQFSWPVFNCADMAIVCGVGIMLLFYNKA